MILRGHLVLFGALALQAIVAPAAGDDRPVAPASGTKDDAPVYVLVDSQADLDALRKKLARPDFVLLKGPMFEAMKAASRPVARPVRAVVESFAIGGEVLDDLAQLTVDLGIHLAGADPAWVPIRLDGQIVTSAREGDRDLPVRAADGGGYEVQVKGDGTHRVQVAVSAVVLPAKGGGEGRRLEWPIPEAASTRVQVVLAANATGVAAMGPGGTREPLALEPIEGGQRSRASAYLTPRKGFEMTWTLRADPGSDGPPLVTAQGEIALDVERGSLLAQSSWAIRSERGTLRRLELRVDEADELVGLQLDGRPVAETSPREPGSDVIAVPLPDPIRAGGSCRLIVTTRRALSAEGTTRVTYRGVPIAGVVAQTGFLAICQAGGDPWVTAGPGRGLSPIDPRAELPTGLRSRPSIVLAYRVAEQPFDLALQIDPSPPSSRVDTRTTVAVDRGRARVDMTLDYAVARGRVFEVRTALPPGFTADSVGPDATVAASEVLAGGRVEPRVLVARLTPKASEDGAFTVRIAGEQAIVPGAKVAVGLPRPVESQSRGGLVAVVTAPGVTADLATDPDIAPEGFAPAAAEPPASWPWPAGGRPVGGRPAFWLRHDSSPSSLPLAIGLRERVVREETTRRAWIDRKRVEVDQVSTLRVQFGSLSRIDLEVPSEVGTGWEVEGPEIVRREPIGPARAGMVPVRLTFAREQSDTARLRFRMGVALDPPLAADRPRKIVPPRIRVVGAEPATPGRVRVGAAPGIDLDGDGPGWSAPEEANSPRDLGPPDRLEHSTGGAVAVVATAHGLLDLPRVVASALTLRTARDGDGALRTSAAYRFEVHDGSLLVTLPEGAEWVRARVGPESVPEVEKAGGDYRLKLPSDGGPVVVTLEYAQPAASVASGAWGAPSLGPGAIVEETTWEVRVPSHLALIGVPAGWSDENVWAWDRTQFARKPAGPGAESGRDGTRAYRFGRVGGPASLAPLVVSGAGVVGIASGVVLALGLAALMARSWGRRATAVGVIALLGLAVAAPPSVVPLALQSSALGFGLVAVAAVTQLLVDRRRPVVHAATSSLSSLRPVAEPGSDEPTVIRNRQGTTVDRAPEPAPASAPG